MPITLAHKNIILNWYFNKSTNIVPTAYSYFGLSTTLVDGLGIVTEPTGGGYARIPYANVSANWNPYMVSSTGSDWSAFLDNNYAITFPKSTASWGTMLSLFIASALTGGTVLWYKTLRTGFIVQKNNTISFVAGIITIGMGDETPGLAP
jgi:hypothetical protein